MNKVLKELEVIKRIVSTSDIINDDEAARFLNISKRALQNYATPKGKLNGTYIINPIGKKMFFKSKLIGLQN